MDYPDTGKKWLEAAKHIAEGILNKAKHEKHGWAWETLSVKDGIPGSRIAEDLYSGNAGILLFFAELYRQVPDARYLEAISNSLCWLEHVSAESPSSWAFYSGRTGVAYAILKAGVIIGEESYQDLALRLVDRCEEHLSSKPVQDDLLHGTAGVLLGLLHIHSLTEAPELLPRIDRFIRRLLDSAHCGPQGLYWDRNHRQIHGLCGFSHGASGIGFVFLELGHYFGNEAFYTLARQAFVYENHHFDEKTANWPDFRKGIFSEEDRREHAEAWFNGDASFFCKGRDVSAWCHGAPGIGFARLRALELLEKEPWAADLEKCLDKTAQMTGDNKLFISPNLCHGIGGNAMLFLQAYRHSKKEEYLAYAYEMAEHIQEDYGERGFYYSGHALPKEEDTSLFLGNAGAGWFFLACADPQGTSSILAPCLDSVCRDTAAMDQPFTGISKKEVWKLILKKEFARTLHLLERENAAALDAFLEGLSGDASLREAFMSFAWQNAAGQLADVLRLEQEKAFMDSGKISSAGLYIEQELRSQRAVEVLRSEEMLHMLRFRLHPGVSLLTTEWNWSEDSPGAEPESTCILLKTLPLGISEEPLLLLGRLVMKCFVHPCSVSEACQQVMGQIDLESEDQESLRGKVIDQVKHALISGVIVEAVD